MTLAQIKFTLRLENLTIDQSGFYGCQAENSVGNGSRQTNVTVVYRPVIPVTTGRPCFNNGISQLYVKQLSVKNDTGRYILSFCESTLRVRSTTVFLIICHTEVSS